jgi:hypothetical protein
MPKALRRQTHGEPGTHPFRRPACAVRAAAPLPLSATKLTNLVTQAKSHSIL